jgi:glycosyltransferase involved in cell wall biosynthesis
MAFCEAAAYGLPSLTTDSGGIPTIVRHGVTGYNLTPTTPAASWAAVLSDAVANPAAYRAMAKASHQDFCARLNWNAFGNRLHVLLRCVAGHTPDCETCR